MESQLLDRVRLTSAKITSDKDRDRLESDLTDLPGVRNVDVNCNDHSVEVRYDPTELSVPKIVETMKLDGYAPDNLDDARSPKDDTILDMQDEAKRSISS